MSKVCSGRLNLTIEWLKRLGRAFPLTVLIAALAATAVQAAERPMRGMVDVPDLAAMCQPAAVQAVASRLSIPVTVKEIPNGPKLPGGAQFNAATANVPAYCQVEGSFVTNPVTGKTANFLATFPAAWNSKYLQIGCSGHCGQFYVSNPATPAVTVTTQGRPGEIVEKGYAAFATDEGHQGMGSADWALKSGGQVDPDYVDDFLYRADKVLAKMGKEFTKAFYANATGTPQNILYSYFCGCSGGGRDAMVAVSYFPDEFDGIIAGSPYDVLGVTFQGSAIGIATARSSDAALSPVLLALMDSVVKSQCDALDGVKDGLIQNPAACNFRPERDLPRCPDNKPGGQCFTQAQIETVSTIVNAVTDEHGDIVQPGYTVSELQVLGAGTAQLGDPVLKIFVHGNDPNFAAPSIFSFTQGGPGTVTGFHAVVPSVEVAAARAALRLGVGSIPENADRFMKGRTKLLMWHNFSDERLTPFMSVNWYKRLASRHGGFSKVQQKARLFMLPGTAHCSISGIGPNSFDAISAMENWVEKKRAPEALLVHVVDRQYTPGAPKAPALQTPNWTMPLCKFPEMARYSGHGDLHDAANWSCPAGDRSLLKVGESGTQAGVIQ